MLWGSSRHGNIPPGVQPRDAWSVTEMPLMPCCSGCVFDRASTQDACTGIPSQRATRTLARTLRAAAALSW